MEPESIEVGAEAGLAAGDAEVGRQRQAESAADRRALHRRHDRLSRAEDAGGLLVEMLAAPPVAAGPGGRPVGEVGAGAERLALGAQHVGADVAVAVERLEGIGDLVDQRIVEEVVRRTLNFDDADMALAADADILEGGAHISLPRAINERRYCPAAGAPVEV